MRQHIIQQGCLFFYCISFCLSSPLSFSPKSHVPRKWVFWELSLWLLWAARGSDSLDLTPRCLSIAGSFLHLVSVPLSLWQQELPPPSPLLQHTHSLPISHLYTTHEYSFGGCFKLSGRSFDNHYNCLKAPTVKYNVINRMDRSPTFVSGIEKKKLT